MKTQKSFLEYSVNHFDQKMYNNSMSPKCVCDTAGFFIENITGGCECDAGSGFVLASDN